MNDGVTRLGSFTEKAPTKLQSTAIAEGSPPISLSGNPPEWATLQLIRVTWGGLLVAFYVELDGFFVGQLAYGATLEVKIPAGDHLLVVSGGGAFVGATARFTVQENDTSAFTVGYSWYGGVKLSRV